MNQMQIIRALNQADDAYIQQAGVAGGHFSAHRAKKKPRVLARILIAAAVVMALTATAFAAGEIIGIWNDRWLQTPASDPIEVVREAVSRQSEKEYTVSVVVDEIRIDEEETSKVLAGDHTSMLALTGGWGADCEALAKRDPEDVTAIYTRYTVEYDHTKTWYRDGAIYQYFYLVRNDAGTWEIFDSSDEMELHPVLNPASDPVSDDSRTPASQDNSSMTEPDSTTAGAHPEIPEGAAGSDRQAEYDNAARAAAEMVMKWEEFEDVESITIVNAVFNPEQTDAAFEYLNGSTLAAGNGWTEDYLRSNMAAVTVTYTVRYAPDSQLPDGSEITENGTYWLLRDPATGVWHNSEITGFMEAAGK